MGEQKSHRPLAPYRTPGCLPLPQEILDFIIDHLYEELATLQASCLVSKAWVQRVRKHLFAHIVLDTPDWSVHRWRETFPDPTNSPAHYVRILSIRCPECIAAGIFDTPLTFHNVIHLDVDTSVYRSQIYPIPSHGIATVVRSLRLVSTSLTDTEVLNLVCSLPLLEDLALISQAPMALEPRARPRTSPRLTGSLELYVEGELQSVIYRLLDLPNGLHFKRIVVRPLFYQDIEPVMDLVLRCSDTLESLSIVYPFSSVFHSIWTVPYPNLTFT